MDKPEIILDFNIPIQYKTQRASLNKPIMARHFFLLFFFGHCDQLLGHFSRKKQTELYNYPSYKYILSHLNRSILTCYKYIDSRYLALRVHAQILVDLIPIREYC